MNWLNGFNEFKQPEKDKGCAVCKGVGRLSTWRAVTCPFCNGTGEFTKAGASFILAHPCQCENSDRQNCPFCNKKCHHGSNNKPRLVALGPPPS